jgi:hypothetical protein
MISPELTLLLAKLAAIVNTVDNKDSVAAATALYAKTEPHRNPEKAAVAEMTLRESEDWKAYLRGTIQLPEKNWEVYQEVPPVSKKSLKNAHRRAEALNRLYQTDQAQPGHSMWFTKRYTKHLPLIKAMASINLAKPKLLSKTHVHEPDSSHAFPHPTFLLQPSHDLRQRTTGLDCANLLSERLRCYWWKDQMKTGSAKGKSL